MLLRRQRWGGARSPIGGLFMSTKRARSKCSIGRLAKIRAIISAASCFRLRPVASCRDASRRHCHENGSSPQFGGCARLFEDLALARSHPRILRNLGRADLLILGDWGLEPLAAAAQHDLLEILEERYGRRSIVITSQLSDRPLARNHRRPDAFL